MSHSINIDEMDEMQCAKMNLMVQAAKIGLWDMEIKANDPDSPDNIFTCSAEFRHMLGFDDETDFPNTIGSWSDRLHPDDKDTVFDAFLKHLMDTTGMTPYDMEYRLQKKDGSYAYYRDCGDTVRDKDGNAVRVAGALLDINERKAMEEAAQNANRAKSSFLAHMSHEMRTPMNSIIGFCELALDADIPQKTRGYLNLIIDNSKWLLQLINDILDISKIESGNMKIEQIPFDLHEIFIACKTLITPIAAEKNIDLFFYAEPFVGKMLIGDPMRLRQALINLLSNAVKFTDAGTVKMAAIIVNDDDGNNPRNEYCTLHFEVKDTGIGMTGEQVEQIFKPFAQADVGTTRKYGGTGLGLTITKTIIELMGGQLNIISTPGVGTRISFEIIFPTTDMEVQTLKMENTASSIDKPMFEGDILVFEDNIMNQRVIIDHLKRVGFNVELAENGQEGVETIRRRMEKGEKPFDLVFMDIHMPIMDGIEATSEIVAMGSATPIIAMTANVMIEDVELYKKTGMRDHIGKPFTSQLLWNVLLKYLKPVSFTEIKGSEYDSDDEVFQNQLKSDFVKNNQNRYNDIIGAYNSGDIKLAHRMTHTLKTTAGQIGKAALQKAAADVEISLKKNDVLPAEATMNIFKAELIIALEELRPFFVETGADAEPETVSADFSADVALKLYGELEPLLKRGSPESLKYMGQLRKIPGNEKLIEQIEDLNFDIAADILISAKKRLEGS